VTLIDGSAFDGCKLRNVLVKCATPPSGGNSFFSDQTYYHSILYIPVGSWDAYAYDDYWYLFHNIRETALTEDQVSEEQAYTLMDVGSFNYSVYDPVNECIRTIKTVGGVDENNPDHSWQVIEANGGQYLYNIGAEKFAVSRPDGTLILSEAPTAIAMQNGVNGIILGSEGAHQWALVGNDHLSVKQGVITSLDGIPTSQDRSVNYDLQGRCISKPQKGVNIVRMKDGTTKKILVK